MTKSNKITWLLILQGWTMLWVVIGHAPLDPPAEGGVDMMMHTVAQALYFFAYSFHMPLFLMISGYLFYRTRVSKGWGYLDMVKDKWLRLAIPYFVFITLALLMKICFPGEMARTVDLSFYGVIKNYIEPYNGALREMWFVAVIFLYFLLYPAYRYLLVKPLVAATVITLGAIAYHFPIHVFPDLFAINIAIHNFIFFFIGMTISRWRLEEKINSWALITVCVVGYVACYILSIGLATAIFASIGFWGLAMKVERTLVSGAFHSFREYTYQIYLIGIFVQIFVQILARKLVFPGSYPFWWLICVLLGVYVPVWLSRIPIISKNRFFRRIIGL